MKCKIERKALVKAIGHALGVVDRRSTMPILSHILITAHRPDEVAIAATDLEMGYREILPAWVEEPGAIALPAQRLSSIIRALPETEIEMTLDSDMLSVSAEESFYRFVGLPADQFPPIPDLTDQPMVEIDGRLLKDMIRMTLFAASTDNFQYHLSSALWEQVDGPEGLSLRFVSTDGHRLALIERPLTQINLLQIGKGILVPHKGMMEISRLAAEEEQVSLGLDSDKKILSLKAGQKYLYVRLMDKRYPDYRRIIPESFAYRFAVDRQMLYNAIRRISLLSTERFREITLHLNLDSLKVSHKSPDVGSGQEILPMTLEQGDPAGLPLTIGINARYLMEPLSVMSGDIVILGLNGKDRPCQLTSQDDPNYINLIMPMV